MTDTAIEIQRFTEEFLRTWSLAWMTGFLTAKGFPDGSPDTPAKQAAEEEGLAAMKANPAWGRDYAAAYLSAKKEMEGTAAAYELHIDPRAGTGFQWIRIDSSQVLSKPIGHFVCEHLKEKGKETTMKELALIAANDPDALDSHCTIRLCAVCEDIYERTNVRRIGQMITAKG